MCNIDQYRLQLPIIIINWLLFTSCGGQSSWRSAQIENENEKKNNQNPLASSWSSYVSIQHSVAYFSTSHSHHISGSRRKQCWGNLSRRRASADKDKRPLPSVCLVWGEKGGKEDHCTLWISLIHSHPIVSILLCDWPEAVRTCITLKIDGKSWHGYIKGAALGPNS